VPDLGKEGEELELEVAEGMYGDDDWYRRDRWPTGMLQDHMLLARVAIRVVSAALAAREGQQPTFRRALGDVRVFLARIAGNNSDSRTTARSAIAVIDAALAAREDPER
jgi:hypothetical protein